MEDDQWTLPVAAVCALYRRFGYGLLLVTAIVESAQDLRDVVTAVGADAHVVVRLETEPETLRRRIVEREPETFVELDELDELVAASVRLGPVIAGPYGIASALSTEERRPVHVAAQIRDAFAGKLRSDRG